MSLPDLLGLILLCEICRMVDNEILLTMDDGRSALKALELDGKEVI